MAEIECSCNTQEISSCSAGFVGAGAFIVYAASITVHIVCACLFKVKISISLLRHCSIEDIKSSARNAWTNIGVTTSLVMTTVVGALIEGHEMSPQGFCMDKQQLLHLQQIYVSLCIACLFANINCIIYCVLNLFYWDSLTEADAVAFLRQNPQVLGETVIYMVESYVFFVLVIGVWFYTTYGQTLTTGIFISFTTTLICNLAKVWTNLIRWKPTASAPSSKTCCGCCRTKSKTCKEEVEWFQLMDAITQPQEGEPQECVTQAVEEIANLQRHEAPNSPEATTPREVEELVAGVIEVAGVDDFIEANEAVDAKLSGHQNHHDSGHVAV